VTVYDIEVRTIDGVMKRLADYRGKTLLIVNVASRCGYTPQYVALEALYRRYQGRGLVVLGFPCNQFGRQEPDDEGAIGEFCSTTYGVTFPMFAKVDVNGSAAHPLFRYLTAARRGILGTKRIKWNFTKFLVDERGDVLRRNAPSVTPDKIEPDIVATLVDSGRVTDRPRP
jgi:glutathione peroxidase